MREIVCFKLGAKRHDGGSRTDSTGNCIPDLWSSESKSFTTKPCARRMMKIWTVNLTISSALRPSMCSKITFGEKDTEAGWLVESECFIGEEGYFEVDTRSNRKPV